MDSALPVIPAPVSGQINNLQVDLDGPPGDKGASIEVERIAANNNSGESLLSCTVPPGEKECSNVATNPVGQDLVNVNAGDQLYVFVNGAAGADAGVSFTITAT